MAAKRTLDTGVGDIPLDKGMQGEFFLCIPATGEGGESRGAAPRWASPKGAQSVGILFF